MKKVVLVGGFGGIATPTMHKLLCKEIDTLVILGCEEDEEMVNKFKDSVDTEILFIMVDVGKPSDVIRAFKKVVCKIKYFDLVINIADLIKEELVGKTINTNLVSPLDQYGPLRNDFF